MEFLITVGNKKPFYMELDVDHEVKEVRKGIKKWLHEKQGVGKRLLIKRSVKKKKAIWITYKIPAEATIEVVSVIQYRNTSTCIVVKEEQKREIEKLIT
ncbi:hypothetical protein [Listeria booriae]|uniref:Uncharacterized protein n=1 Tax=Listeria booriae TaxID=1552123 RepID=A0A842A3R5_9LIST|nr:hypothetical protein [Listeria booriae]MBC1567237.1 hypothetical protein [Listeria booriae]